jgi:hypothetical protein
VRIDILPEARGDLLAGFQFYERERAVSESILSILYWQTSTCCPATAVFTARPSDIIAV